MPERVYSLRSVFIAVRGSSSPFSFSLEAACLLLEVVNERREVAVAGIGDKAYGSFFAKGEVEVEGCTVAAAWVRLQMNELLRLPYLTLCTLAPASLSVRFKDMFFERLKDNVVKSSWILFD